jgi:hypothetical protein
VLDPPEHPDMKGAPLVFHRSIVSSSRKGVSEHRWGGAVSSAVWVSLHYQILGQAGCPIQRSSLPFEGYPIP